MDWQSIVSPKEPQPIPRLGSRYDHTGRFLPEAGNTVVAQVVAGSQTQTALNDLRTALQALPHAGNFAFTAPASYHMTVFEGVIETNRSPQAWPADVPLDLPIPEVTSIMAYRLASFSAPADFKMRITAVTPFGLRLTGATPQDEAAARSWRDALSRALHLRAPSHDAYQFHTTLAYMIAHLPAEALPVWHQALADLTADLQRRLPVLDLGRPAFCRFADMNAFPPVLPL